MAFGITHGIEECKPILPPLHSLNLPFISSHDNLRYYHQRNSQHIHSRRMSSSSSCTSPSESGSPSRPSSPDPAFSLPTNLRLEPCSLDKADAVILIPPPTTTADSKSANLAKLTITTNTKTSKPLFLVGPALHSFRLRHPPSRPLAKDARVHPYRIVRNLPKRQKSHHPSD